MNFAWKPKDTLPFVISDLSAQRQRSHHAGNFSGRAPAARNFARGFLVCPSLAPPPHLLPCRRSAVIANFVTASIPIPITSRNSRPNTCLPSPIFTTWSPIAGRSINRTIAATRRKASIPTPNRTGTTLSIAIASKAMSPSGPNVFGQQIFLNFTASSETFFDGRRVPSPSGVSAAEPGSSGFFGRGEQAFFDQTLRFSFDLFPRRRVL